MLWVTFWFGDTNGPLQFSAAWSPFHSESGIQMGHFFRQVYKWATFLSQVYKWATFWARYTNGLFFEPGIQMGHFFEPGIQMGHFFESGIQMGVLFKRFGYIWVTLLRFLGIHIGLLFELMVYLLTVLPHCPDVRFTPSWRHHIDYPPRKHGKVIFICFSCFWLTRHYC